MDITISTVTEFKRKLILFNSTLSGLSVPLPLPSETSNSKKMLARIEKTLAQARSQISALLQSSRATSEQKSLIIQAYQALIFSLIPPGDLHRPLLGEDLSPSEKLLSLVNQYKRYLIKELKEKTPLEQNLKEYYEALQSIERDLLEQFWRQKNLEEMWERMERQFEGQALQEWMMTQIFELKKNTLPSPFTHLSLYAYYFAHNLNVMNQKQPQRALYLLLPKALYPQVFQEKFSRYMNNVKSLRFFFRKRYGLDTKNLGITKESSIGKSLRSDRDRYLASVFLYELASDMPCYGILKARSFWQRKPWKCLKTTQDFENFLTIIAQNPTLQSQVIANKSLCRYIADYINRRVKVFDRAADKKHAPDYDEPMLTFIQRLQELPDQVRQAVLAHVKKKKLPRDHADPISLGNIIAEDPDSLRRLFEQKQTEMIPKILFLFARKDTFFRANVGQVSDAHIFGWMKSSREWLNEVIRGYFQSNADPQGRPQEILFKLFSDPDRLLSGYYNWLLKVVLDSPEFTQKLKEKHIFYANIDALLTKKPDFADRFIALFQAGSSSAPTEDSTARDFLIQLLGTTQEQLTERASQVAAWKQEATAEMPSKIIVSATDRNTQIREVVSDPTKLFLNGTTQLDPEKADILSSAGEQINIEELFKKAPQLIPDLMKFDWLRPGTTDDQALFRVLSNVQEEPLRRFLEKCFSAEELLKEKNEWLMQHINLNEFFKKNPTWVGILLYALPEKISSENGLKFPSDTPPLAEKWITQLLKSRRNDLIALRQYYVSIDELVKPENAWVVPHALPFVLMIPTLQANPRLIRELLELKNTPPDQVSPMLKLFQKSSVHQVLIEEIQRICASSDELSLVKNEWLRLYALPHLSVSREIEKKVSSENNLIFELLLIDFNKPLLDDVQPIFKLFYASDSHRSDLIALQGICTSTDELKKPENKWLSKVLLNLDSFSLFLEKNPVLIQQLLPMDLSKGIPADAPLVFRALAAVEEEGIKEAGMDIMDILKAVQSKYRKIVQSSEELRKYKSFHALVDVEKVIRMLLIQDKRGWVNAVTQGNPTPAMKAQWEQDHTMKLLERVWRLVEKKTKELIKANIEKWDSSSQFLPRSQSVSSTDSDSVSPANETNDVLGNGVGHGQILGLGPYGLFKGPARSTPPSAAGTDRRRPVSPAR